MPHRGSERIAYRAVRWKIMGDGTQDRDVSAALDVLSRKLSRIDAMPGGDAKTAAIRELAEEIQKLYNRAAGIRKSEMFRIRKQEELSLGKLAGRVGISKARADQLIRAAERERQKEAGHA
jgi:hypothetical protein